MTVREAYRRALSLLSPRDRRKLALVTGAQMAVSLLDLLGVLLLGLVGTLALTIAQGVPPAPIVATASSALGLEGLSDIALLYLLAATAAMLFLSKSVISSYLIRRTFRFLANRQAVVSQRLVAALLSQPLAFVQQRSSQATSYALVQGTSNATLVMLGQGVIFASELSLLIALAVLLLVVSPIVAVTSIAFFGLVALVLQLALGRWALRVGQQSAAADIASIESVQEVMNAYREITVADRRAFYVTRFQSLRWRAADSAADVQFMSSLPKYVFEIALVVGGLVLSAVLFSTQGAIDAVGTLALFIAAGTRVMPALLRIQGASLSMRNAAGLCSSAIELAEALNHSTPGPRLRSPDLSRLRSTDLLESSDFDSSVRLNEVTFTYPGTSRPAITDASMFVPAGTSLAIVGPSGAGKSTLADLVLGVLEPELGSVRIGSTAPNGAVTRWPGAIAYVPQDVAVANASVRFNVALGIPAAEIDDDKVWEALERARLKELVSRTPDGLDTQIGERGHKFSGGQRQRLGIARALYTRPGLLVLDEATSALDAQTESDISETIRSLEGATTTVVIAHRLATVRHADQVIYLEEGRILSQGRFDVVRSQVPALNEQARILGLL